MHSTALVVHSTSSVVHSAAFVGHTTAFLQYNARRTQYSVRSVQYSVPRTQYSVRSAACSIRRAGTTHISVRTVFGSLLEFPRSGRGGRSGISHESRGGCGGLGFRRAGQVSGFGAGPHCRPKANPIHSHFRPIFRQTLVCKEGVGSSQRNYNFVLSNIPVVCLCLQVSVAHNRQQQTDGCPKYVLTTHGLIVCKKKLNTPSFPRGKTLVLCVGQFCATRTTKHNPTEVLTTTQLVISASRIYFLNQNCVCCRSEEGFGFAQRRWRCWLSCFQAGSPDLDILWQAVAPARCKGAPVECFRDDIVEEGVLQRPPEAAMSVFHHLAAAIAPSSSAHALWEARAAAFTQTKCSPNQTLD